ncbi:MAG: alpha/beta hydrolase, partial [Lachnospiraceae bacterium]|nr:alpha/beta hydrolase [Lachnospiraceae bacterium]
MSRQRKNRVSLALAICLLIAVLSMVFANLIQTDFGKIDVVTAAFRVGEGSDAYDITYKMYIPKDADESNPKPALLCLHGYQNDKETSAAYAMEAARRGIVAVCIDEFGHGSNERSMKYRGYTTYKVQGVNADGTETTVKTKISGPERFLLMMNFSTLSFFEGEAFSVNEGTSVTLDADKDGVVDSSMGGIAAFNWLKTLPFVDAENIAITGHSMGTWASWSVAAACRDHKAVVLQCGEVFGDNMFDEENVEFHNVLMLQARYDEFNYFRDYRQETVNDSMLDSGIRNQFFTANQRTEASAPFTWNT